MGLLKEDDEGLAGVGQVFDDVVVIIIMPENSFPVKYYIKLSLQLHSV